MINGFSILEKTLLCLKAVFKGLTLRIFLGVGLLILGLSGCVNYANIHSKTHLLSASNLANPSFDTYSPVAGWWQQFENQELNQLINIGFADSPSIQQAKARIDKAMQFSAQIDSALSPSIGADGYLQRQRFSETGLIPPPYNGKTFNIGSADLNFNYEFDFWGKHRQAFAASLSEIKAREAELAQTKLLLSAAIVQTYVELDTIRQQTQIAKQRQQNFQQILDIVKDRAMHGVDSNIPLNSALASLESATLLLTRLQEADAIILHRLAALIGKDPFRLVVKTHSLPIIALPKTLPANLLGKRPDILASRLHVEAYAHRINVAKSRFFPNINLNAVFGYQSIFLGKLFNQQNRNDAATAAIDLPIFDASARRANLGQRYADYDIAVSQYNDTLLQALRQVSDQISTIHSAKIQLTLQNKIFKASEEKYQLVNARFKNGITDYLQVLENKTSVLEQQSTKINVRNSYTRAMVTLFKVLGGTL